jgi:hypothetical protein
MTFDTGGQLAKQFANARFERTDTFIKEELSNKKDR